MAEKNVLLHRLTQKALEGISDPEKSKTLDIVEGKCPGKLDLIYGLFPPKGVHRNDAPVKFGFKTRTGYYFEIYIMVSLVSCDDGDGPVSIFGFVQHDQGQSLNVEKTFNPHNFFVVVKFNFITRGGQIHLSLELLEKIEESFILNKDS